MILIHHCGNCGHTDLETRSRPSGNGKIAAELNRTPCARTCKCQNHTYGRPVAAPSFTDTGRPIERLAPPGTKLHGTLATCTCGDCKAEYARLTPEVAA